MFFCLFCLHRALEKIQKWKLIAHGKIKSRRESLVKKKEKKKQAQRRQKENHSVKKKRKSTVKATGTGGILRLRPDFHFIYLTSTSHDTKSLKIASRRNFET